MFEIIYRYDPDNPRGRRSPASANEARTFLEEGNRSFASRLTDRSGGSRVVPLDLEDFGLSGSGTVAVQRPFAVVLGCSDARVPTEMIFERTSNEMFVVRVAGNIIGQELLGSIDYAVEQFDKDLKLILVLGHSQCGAVTAAVDAYLEPASYLGLSTSHHLRSIINILFPPVRGAVSALSLKWGDAVSRLPGYRAALIECSVIINAAMVASILKSEFGDPTKDRRIVFGIYDLASRHVHVSLQRDGRAELTTSLCDAPVGREQFQQFASKVVSSAHITRCLESNSDLLDKK